MMPSHLPPGLQEKGRKPAFVKDFSRKPLVTQPLRYFLQRTHQKSVSGGFLPAFFSGNHFNHGFCQSMQ